MGFRAVVLGELGRRPIATGSPSTMGKKAELKWRVVGAAGPPLLAKE